MSTLNRSQNQPKYPDFNEYGYKPMPEPWGPPDVWPSGHNNAYTAYAGAHGRHLAGVENMHADGIETYPNELNQLAQADDTAGNGVFDPNGSHGNVHPDEGVFADHQSLPGYIDREVFYQPGEVQDLPGGGTTMFVPGGAVSFQQGQPETLREQRLLWELPNSVRPYEINPIRQRSTVSAPTAAEPVSGWDTMTSTNKLLVAAGVGVAVGLAALAFSRSRK